MYNIRNKDFLLMRVCNNLKLILITSYKIVECDERDIGYDLEQRISIAMRIRCMHMPIQDESID